MPLAREPRETNHSNDPAANSQCGVTLVAEFAFQKALASCQARELQETTFRQILRRTASVG